MYATLPRCAALTASCSSGQHFVSGFLQISPRDEHPCLPLTLPLTGCVEDFHLLVVFQPPQLKNSASHGATRHARRTYRNGVSANDIRQHWQKENPKFRVIYQPVSSPWVNHVERLWQALHDTITRNHQCRSMWQLLKKVHYFMKTVSPFPCG